MAKIPTSDPIYIVLRSNGFPLWDSNSAHKAYSNSLTWKTGAAAFIDTGFLDNAVPKSEVPKWLSRLETLADYFLNNNKAVGRKLLHVKDVVAKAYPENKSFLFQDQHTAAHMLFTFVTMANEEYAVQKRCPLYDDSH